MSSKLPLTVASVRDQIRNNHFYGDVFEGLAFMVTEYDALWKKYREIARPNEYHVTTDVERIDVV